MTGKQKATASGSGSMGSEAPKFVAQLSRKVKACDECRRHKIRCNLPASGTPPCTRCSKNGMECKLTKSLQSILDERQSDSEWRTSVERRLEAVFKAFSDCSRQALDSQALTALQHVMQQERSNSRAAFGLEEEEGEYGRRTGKRRREEVAVNSDSPEGNLGLLADAASVGEGVGVFKQQWDEEEGGAQPASAPGEHLRQLAEPNLKSMAPNVTTYKHRAGHQADIIDQGLITLSQACTLIDIYLKTLDRHAYSIVSHQHCPPNQRHESIRLRDSVTSIRKSPLLLLAICTVASLHCTQAIGNDGIMADQSTSSVATRLHISLYNEFVRISAQRSFVRHQTIDDVRALLIASWWLRELSWIFTASSVRLATERGMQESYKKCSDLQAGRAWVIKGPEEACFAGCAVADGTAYSEAERSAYEEARLYYLVYVADHQAAIPFGRPPMTRQHAAVRNARAWLAGCGLAGQEDARLISHVELWVIAHDVVDDFGVDVQESLSKVQVLEQVPRFAALIDQWWIRWRRSGLLVEEVVELEHEAEMMRLFIDAHAFRAPQGVSPLLIQKDEEEIAAAFSLGLDDDVERRETFAHKSLPKIPLESANERQSRFNMGARAVQSAHRLLAYHQQPSVQTFGQPLYPQVMLIFACLFLNKLSKTYGEDLLSPVMQDRTERLSLPLCERGHVLKVIEGIVDMLRQQIVGKCVADQMCAAAIPGLSSIITEAKRQLSREHVKRPSLPAKSPHSLSTSSLSIEPSSPAFSFDLQSLDLLSDTRFLSGFSNDASLWTGQEWWTNTNESNGTWS